MIFYIQQILSTRFGANVIKVLGMVPSNQKSVGMCIVYPKSCINDTCDKDMNNVIVESAV